MFIYSLANELKKSLSELCQTLTIEEMVGWAAFYELKKEQEKKEMEKIQKKKRYG